MRRRAHERTDPTTGQKIRVAEHEVRSRPGPAAPVTNPTQNARLRRQAERAADADAMNFYAFDDLIDGPDDTLGTADDSDGYVADPGEPSWNDPNDGFDEFDAGEFSLDDDDDGDGFGFGYGYGGGHARNGIEYAMRQQMLGRGGGGGAAPTSGLKFNPEASFFGRLFAKFGGRG